MEEKLIVVMPVYNEEACIKEVVEDWVETLGSEKIHFKLLVINDGSKDRSWALLQELQSKHPQLILLNQENQGHGNSIINGYREALKNEASFIFQCDSDNQIPTSEFHKLWKMRAECPCVWAFRKKRKDPLSRLLISEIMKLLALLRHRTRIKDPNVPFRLMPNDFLKRQIAYLEKHRPFAPNIYLSIAAKKNYPSLPIVGVKHLARETGKGSLMSWKLLRVCIRSFREILGFRFAKPETREKA